MPKPATKRPRGGKSAAEEKAERIDLVRDMLARGYTPNQVMTWMQRDTVDKDWKIGHTTARAYLNAALEQDHAEVAQPKDRKQARTRAMLTLVYQKAMDLAARGDGRAAGLLNAAIQACDKIARIDGAYGFDASSLLPPTINPATPEDAVRLVAHAQATIDLARRRGALVAKNPPPPVIDVDATEREDDEDAADVDDAN